MGTQTYTSKLVVQACCDCGMMFGVEKSYDDRRRGDGGTFYCPAGHPQVYSEPSYIRDRRRAEEAERQRDYAYRERDRASRAAQDALHRARAQKAAKTRLKKRIANGVCPCCNRHFANVERHVKSQHPEYVATTDR